MTVKQQDQWSHFSLKREMSIAVFVGCAIILFQILSQLMPVQQPAPQMLGFFLGVAVGITVHELGHVAAALIVKFTIFSFTVGPITLRRESGSLRLRTENFRVGGMVTAVPLHSDNLAPRMLVMTVGGPAGSFIGGGLEYFLGRIFHNSPWSSWMFPLALTSWGLGVISLVPMRRFYVSDGARILQLLGNAQEADRFCALLTIAAYALAGQRPRDWEPTLINKALAARKDSGDYVLATIMAYEFQMDLHHFDLAESYLHSAIAQRPKCPPNVKSSIAADAAFFFAVVRNDAPTAREWLDQCHARHIQAAYVLPMVEAAVLIAEGRTGEADFKLDTCMTLLQRTRFPGFALAAQDWIAAMRERVRAAGDLCHRRD